MPRPLEVAVVIIPGWLSPWWCSVEPRRFVCCHFISLIYDNYDRLMFVWGQGLAGFASIPGKNLNHGFRRG